MIIGALTVMEASIATIAVAFVVLVIYLVIASIKLRRSVELAQEDFHNVTLELSHFLSKATEVGTEIQQKAEHFLDSLASSKESPSGSSKLPDQLIKPLKLVSWLVSGFSLAKKTKNIIHKLW